MRGALPVEGPGLAGRLLGITGGGRCGMPTWVTCLSGTPFLGVLFLGVLFLGVLFLGVLFLGVLFLGVLFLGVLFLAVTFLAVLVLVVLFLGVAAGAGVFPIIAFLPTGVLGLAGL